MSSWFVDRCRCDVISPLRATTCYSKGTVRWRRALEVIQGRCALLPRAGTGAVCFVAESAWLSLRPTVNSAVWQPQARGLPSASSILPMMIMIIWTKAQGRLTTAPMTVMVRMSCATPIPVLPR